MSDYDYAEDYGRPRRRHHPLRALLIVLLVLIVLAIVADRVGVVVADNMAASRIEKSENLSQKPSVSIKGFPFLTQAAAMDFGHVTASAHSVDNNGVMINDVQVDMHGVKPTSNFNSAHVNSLTGTGYLDYANLSSYASQHLGSDVTVGPGPAGDVAIKGSFYGIPATLDASVTILSNNRVNVTANKLDGASVPGLSSLDLGRLSFVVPLGDLPFGLVVTGVSTSQSGVTITADGTNTTLTSQ